MHFCVLDQYDAPCDGYGDAIIYVAERDGGDLWAGNDECGTQVNFCPFCGYEAKVKIGQLDTGAWNGA